MVEKRILVSQQGIRLALRLTPHGGRDAIEGWMQGDDGGSPLKARVAAAPEWGKANAALIALLAKKLAIAKARISIVSGETARMKAVQIAGDGVALSAALESSGDKT